MKLFGVGKKAGDLKTLSEKEIQVKLYGHLRSPHSGASRDGGIATLPKPAQTASNVAPQTFTPADRTQASFSQPAGAQPGPARPAFNSTKPSSSVLSEPAPQKAFQPARSSGKFFSSVFSFLASKLLPGIVKILKSVIVFAVQLVVAALGAVTQIFLKIDFKNPRVRRTFYWTFGVGILFFLFAGIHVLNMKREFAMRHPNRAVPIKPKIQKPAQQIPAQVASQTLLSESSSAESAHEDVKPLAPATASGSPAKTVTAVESASSGAEDVSAIKGQVIQIATFATLSDAEKLCDRLKTDGWKCFAKPLVRPGGRTYYCVFLGPFKTYQDAEAKLNAFKKKEIAKPFQDAFIRSL